MKIITNHIKATIYFLKSLILRIFNTIQSHPTWKSLSAKLGTQNLNFFIQIAGLVMILVIMRSCIYGEKQRKDNTPPITAVVETIQKGDMPLYLSTIGTVTPTDTIALKSQINGRLIKVLFEEGKMVKKGQVLAEIDPQPYQAQLMQSEGQLLKDQAILDNAVLDLKRYEKLLKEDSISQQTLDTQKALVKQYEGIVQTDQGAVDSAKVNLQYCVLVSEIDGVIGLLAVDPGNYVQTSDPAPLAIINAINPITVLFPISEDHLPEIQEKFAHEGDMVVDVFDKKSDQHLATGRLTAIDSQIDPTTGTVKLKADFPNDNASLFPNQFVNVRLHIDTLEDALIVPTAAIQMGSKGNFIYVVNPEKETVSAQQVKIVTTLDHQAAITGNIAEGQLIVSQGQDKLTEGSKIKPVSSHKGPSSP